MKRCMYTKLNARKYPQQFLSVYHLWCIYDLTNMENWGHLMIFAVFGQSDLMCLESCYFLIESVFWYVLVSYRSINKLFSQLNQILFFRVGKSRMIKLYQQILVLQTSWIFKRRYNVWIDIIVYKSLSP